MLLLLNTLLVLKIQLSSQQITPFNTANTPQINSPVNTPASSPFNTPAKTETNIQVGGTTNPYQTSFASPYHTTNFIAVNTPSTTTFKSEKIVIDTSTASLSQGTQTNSLKSIGTVTTSVAQPLNPATITTTTTAATATSLPITHVLLVFENNNSYRFNKSDFQKAFSDKNIKYNNLTINSNVVNQNFRKREAAAVNKPSNITVYFILKNNNTQDWTNYINKELPINVTNINNETISTNRNVIFGNDTVCNKVKCANKEGCELYTPSNPSDLRCTCKSSCVPASLSDTPKKDLHLYLALLAIPIFILLIAAIVVVYCCCCARKKENVDGKFEMSQVHSTGFDYDRQDQQRNTISSRGSDQKYPLPYADDEESSAGEAYDYKKEKSTDCDSALIPLLCVHG